MEMHLGVFFEPTVVLLVRVEIVENDVKLAIWKGSHDLVHEAKELDPAASLRMCRDDFSGSNFERCEQGCGSVPFVIVALAGQGAPVWQLQIALRTLQGLDRRLLVDAQYDRLGGRSDIEPDHVGCFCRESGVIALAPGFARPKIDLVLAQEAPDILNVNVAQSLGQQRPSPAGIAHRRPLIQKRQNALVRGNTVDRLFGRSRTVLQPIEAVVGKAAPPTEHSELAAPHPAELSAPGSAPQAPCVSSASAELLLLREPSRP